MRKYLVLLSCILCFFVLNAQNEENIKDNIGLTELYNLYNKRLYDTFKKKNTELIKDTVYFSKFEKAKYYNILGKFKEKKDQEDVAFLYFKKAEVLFKELDRKEWLADVQYSIFYVLKSKKNFKKESEKYLDKVHNYALKNKDKKRLLKAYLGYALINYDKINYKRVKEYYDKVISLSKEIKDDKTLAKGYANMGILYSSYYRKPDSSRYYFQKAIDIYHKLNNDRLEFAITQNIGVSYKNEGNYDKAVEWFLKADKVFLKNNKYNFKQILYKNISKVYKEKKDYKNAYKYLIKHNLYKDSVNIEKQTIAMADTEKRYHTIEKEKENIKLRAEKKQQQFIIYGTLAGLIFSLLFGSLAYRDLRRKREIAEKNREIERQKVISLVKEQEFLAMDAMIEGQEVERKRLAEDLHDNLGSTLATLKMHFDTYKVHISKKNKTELKILERTEDILSEAYDKVRTMAHTNHAGVMAEHGLIGSVDSLVQKIASANKTTVDFVHFGFDTSIPSTLELFLFRIIQELLTNIIKHAKADNVSIDLNMFKDQISLIIEDDGVGFEFSKIEMHENSGMGLQSIKSRIEKENGIFAVDSRIGKGTTIIVEIPLKPEI